MLVLAMQFSRSVEVDEDAGPEGAGVASKAREGCSLKTEERTLGE
jgi:hypothetical protein